jgi:glycosyltransferase involved in cell wall biosynthesis
MKKKILHITKITGLSGSEKHLLFTLPALSQEKYAVSLLLLVEPRDRKKHFEETFRKKGIRTFVFPIYSDFDLSLIYRLYKFIRKNKFTLVHTHLIHADLYGLVAAKIARVPLCISTRHNDDPFRKNFLIKFFNQITSRWLHSLITISDYLKNFEEKETKMSAYKITTIHYGITLNETENNGNNLKKIYHVPKKNVVLGIISRLVPQKGHQFLLTSFREVVKRFSHLTLFIVGDGYLRKDLEKLAEKLGIESKVIFTGYQKNVDSFIKIFDIFVHPSLWEGFGLIFLEVMKWGKPIIATHVSAIPEIIINGKTGILVPPKDSAQLAEAIIKLVVNKNLREKMGRAGYERLKTHFTLRKTVQKTEEVYDKLMAGKNFS